MVLWNEPQRNALICGDDTFTTSQCRPLQVSETRIRLHMHLKMCSGDKYKELAHSTGNVQEKKTAIKETPKKRQLLWLLQFSSEQSCVHGSIYPFFQKLTVALPSTMLDH